MEVTECECYRALVDCDATGSVHFVLLPGPPPESPGREERGDSVKNAMEAKDSCYRRSIAVKWVVEESGTPDAVILRLRAAKV